MAVIIDWFGRGGGGIPNILGGYAEPEKVRGGVAYNNSKIQILGCWLDVEECIWKFMCYFITNWKNQLKRVMHALYFP